MSKRREHDEVLGKLNKLTEGSNGRGYAEDVTSTSVTGSIF